MHLSTLDIRDVSRGLVRELGMLTSDWEETRCSTSQCHALLELSLNGSMRSSDIADALLLDRSTTSRLLSSLRDDGLVLEKSDPKDGRIKWLRLSASGKRKVEKINRIADEKVAAALGLMEEEERNTAIEGMRAYARALSRSRVQSEYTIRKIRPGDNDAIARIIRSVMTEHGAVGEGYSINDPEVDRMAQSYRGAGCSYWVVEKEGVVLGGAGFGPLAGGEKHVCELRKMYLLPDLRGLGFGARLIRLCLDEAKKMGYRYCYLETISAMVRARRLYEAFGFQLLRSRMGETGHSGCGDFLGREL